MGIGNRRNGSPVERPGEREDERRASGGVVGGRAAWRDAVVVGREAVGRGAMSHLGAAFELAGDAIILLDRHGVALAVNPSARAILAPNDILGDLTPERPQDLDREPRGLERRRGVRLRDADGVAFPAGRGPIERALAGEAFGGEHAVETVVRATDGRELVCVASVAQVRGPAGQITGAVLCLRDVTEQRRLTARLIEAVDGLMATARVLTTTVEARAVDPSAAERDVTERGVIETGVTAAAAAEVAKRLRRAIARTAEVAVPRTEDGEPGRFESADGVGAPGRAAAERVARQAIHAQARAATHGLQHVGSAGWRQNAIPTARTALERALALLNDRQDVERGRVLAALALLPARSAREWASGEMYTRQALAIADRVGDAHLDAQAARAAVAGPYARAHNLAAGRLLLRRALERAETGNDAEVIVEACLSHAAACAWMGDVGEADETAARGVALAVAHGLASAARRLGELRGMQRAARGDWIDEPTRREVPSAGGGKAASMPEPWTSVADAFTAYQRERYDDAEREILAVRPRDGSLVVRLVFGGVLGLVHVGAGQLEAARTDLADLEPLLADLPAESVYAVAALAARALYDVARGDRRHGVVTYSALLSFQGLMPWILVDRALGELAVLTGDWEAAERHLRDAEAVAAREGLRPEWMRTLEALADLEAARGGAGSVDRERVLVAAALALADRLGLVGSARRLRGRAHALARHQDLSEMPAGLTDREVDVLRLLAAGQSNRRIAWELGLSEKTVAHHVSSIRTKTACENRAAAAAFAVRHRLA